ncbi:MAG: hypothetical protein KF795_11650 [Labilithrix sp.]|nr:hypothetical protein [Labilithrix sp.]
MDLAYIAHSERCALLLDGDGICRWVVPKADASDATVAAARRCVGAQYVAALDADAPGFMGHEPRVGTNLLFAVVTDGRVALVRFGPLQSFEKLDAPTSAAVATARESAAVSTAPSPGVDGAREHVVPTAAVSEPLPPTVADVPDLEDVIASFSPDSVADIVVEHAPAEDAGADEPARAVAEEAGSAELRAADAADAEAEEVDAELAEAGEADVLLREAGDVEAGRGEAGEADAELAFAIPLASGADLDVVTTAFARSERFAAALRYDAEVELDTGSFALASSRALDSGDAFMAETEREPRRPSGFVMRRARPIEPTDTTPELEPAAGDGTFATDDETRRFSRAAGDVPFKELDRPSGHLDPPRRGMLPRR